MQLVDVYPCEISELVPKVVCISWKFVDVRD